MKHAFHSIGALVCKAYLHWQNSARNVLVAIEVLCLDPGKGSGECESLAKEGHLCTVLLLIVRYHTICGLQAWCKVDPGFTTVQSNHPGAGKYNIL